MKNEPEPEDAEREEMDDRERAQRASDLRVAAWSYWDIAEELGYASEGEARAVVSRQVDQRKGLSAQELNKMEAQLREVADRSRRELGRG